MNRLRLKNFAATVTLIALALAIYVAIPQTHRYFSRYTVVQGTLITHWQVLGFSTSCYVVALFFYYALVPAPRTSKSIWALGGLRRIIFHPRDTWDHGLPANERLGLLSVLVKAFFVPLMVASLFQISADIYRHGGSLSAHWSDPARSYFDLFKANGFWFLLKIIFFADVFFFTLGYLIELPSLKNEIRSVDPTIMGWAVTLACYPPFNQATNWALGWHTTEYPEFADPSVQVAASILLLVLMGLYAWASVTLNFRASNLTHRGIIGHGPYRYIRHPAYVCKNLAWWVGLTPALAIAWNTSVWSALTVIASMSAWSMLYVLRALTEERHLRSVDGSYDQYCRTVRYRFVPGLA